ncbi:Ubiquitin--protein ligase [Bertholletia excelsa]
MLCLGLTISRVKNTSASSGNSINLESNQTSKNKDVMETPEISEVPPPRPPIFCCPVCMGQYREEMSTICGHIFCRECIYSVIFVQGKSATCRQKIKVKDTLRIYLPATD